MVGCPASLNLHMLHQHVCISRICNPSSMHWSFVGSAFRFLSGLVVCFELGGPDARKRFEMTKCFSDAADALAEDGISIMVILDLFQQLLKCKIAVWEV